MLLHEKMRLQRKQNKLTLKQLHNGNMLSRMESKVKKREKYYSKLEKQLERQATAYKNYATNNANSIFTCGFDPSGIYAGAGAYGTNGLQEQAFALASQGLSDNVKQALQIFMQSGSYAFHATAATKDNTDNKTKKYECDAAPGLTLSAEEWAQVNQASRYVQQCQSAITQQINNYKTQYAQQVDEWLEAMKEQLDGQKEWEMDLLAEEQADFEAEKESIAAELELVKQRKESIEQELGSSIKDAAPKFGLA